MMASGTGQSIARSVSGISHFSEHRGADNESQASKNPADKADKASKVNVIVRLRPPASQGEDISEVFVADKTNVTVRDPLSRGRMEHHFVFDQVFSPDHGQEAVFEVVAKPLVDHLLSGFNSCCFAYGQTGSGKTHSVFGEGNKEQRGLLARSIEYLFDKIEAQSSQKEVGMVVSFLEIYLDQVRDLGRFYLEGQAEEELPVSKTSSNPKLKNSQSGRSLSRPSSAHGEKEQSNHPSSRPSSGKGAERSRTSGNISNPDDAEDLYVRQDLPIHETPQGLVYVEDLSLIPVTNIREVLSIANLGVQMRATFETRLNARSSRSHTIFSVSIVQKSKSDPKSGVVGSVLNFVDLAGSERLARSQSEGRRFQEAVIINSSLSALGKVVLALASDKARHIPYRDSKLTRILQNSLGGNSYTTLLTTVDPSAANYEESLNSLFFADRCQNVQNKPVQNVARSDEGNDKAISKLTLEIVNLKHQLEVGWVEKHHSPGQGQGPAPPGASGARSMIQRQRTGGTGAMSMAMSMASAAQEDQGPDLDDVLEQAAGKLASERRMAFQLEARIQEAQDSLDKARIEQLRRDDVKRKESNAIKNSIKALQLELQKTQQRFDFLRAELDADAANLTQDVHRRARGLKHQRMSMTDTFSRALVFSAQIGEDGVESVAKANIETACAKIEKDFSSFSKRLERSFATEQSQLPTPYEQWFQEQEARAERTLAFRAKCIGECAEKRKKIQGELVSAWDLAKRLHKILDALVAGVPNDHRSKVRRVDPTIPRVTLPVVGSVPSSRRPSKAESVEETPRTLAGKIASLLVGLPDPPLRADAKEIREQLCKQEATPMSAPSGPSPGPSGPSVPSGPGCRPGSRPGSAPPARPPSAGFARSASSECESVVASGEDVSWWDAEGFAREFCDVKEPGADAAAEAAEARAVLESLDAARLRALCTSLRRRASMTASEKAAEQAKLAEEVARRLSRTETVDRIRDLEREIAKYREQQVGQQEEQLNLECVLKHGCESWSSLGA